MKTNVYAHPTLREHWSEEYECTTIYLDDRSVPKIKDDHELSLVGRIEEYSVNRELYLEIKELH